MSGVTTNVQCAFCDHTEPVAVELQLSGINDEPHYVGVQATVPDDAMADALQRFRAHFADCPRFGVVGAP